MSLKPPASIALHDYGIFSYEMRATPGHESFAVLPSLLAGGAFTGAAMTLAVQRRPGCLLVLGAKTSDYGTLGRSYGAW